MTSSICDHLVDEYLAWLRQGISVADVGGVCEITTPFLDRHNDHLQIYVKTLDNGRLLLSDDGYVMADLRASGYEFATTRRRCLLDTILNGFGVRFEGERLQVEAARGQFAQKKHDLLQAMIAVNDLFVTAAPQVAQLFREDVERFLALHQVRFTPTIRFTGRSGFDHHFDFVIPRSPAYPERIIRAISSPSREQATSLIFAWTDTREARPADSRVFAVLNDSERPVPEEILSAFQRYEVGTIEWSNRDQYAGELAA